MNDDSLASDGFEPDQALEDDELLARIIEFDESLRFERTPSCSIDDTNSELSEPTRDRLDSVLECLEFIADIRQEYAEVAGAQNGVEDGRDFGRQPTEVAGAQLTIGRFEVVQELGRGGHGVVFLADDAVLRRRVALKVPRPEFLLSKSMRERFISEAQAAARLDHPNIVKVFDAGIDGAVCYIAQELCNGPSLASWLRERPNGIEPSVAASITMQLANGLAHAHQRGTCTAI